MKKLLSAHYSPAAFNIGVLLFRIVIGVLMMHHGYQKLVNFSTTASYMPAMFGMSQTIAAAMDVFAEFFCALFIILGLFTRFAAVPLIIAMCVALFHAHNGDFFGKGELATLYLVSFFLLLLIGPGKVSVDNMIGK